VDLDRSVSQNASSGLLCERRSQRKDLPQGVGSDSEPYRARHCFTDFWAASQAVIAEEQHTAVGKETGETAHVERWKNTLRQRVARFVGKTLSFSKSLMMHDLCLRLFLHRSHLERASILM
jgi:IS1 transposase